MTERNRRYRRGKGATPGSRGGAVQVALALLCAALAGCSDPEPTQARATPTALSGIRYLAAAGEEADGFARAIEPRRFEFPADHGSHPDYRTEWWYFTGNLLDQRGRHYGFELTLFRIALASQRAQRASSLASNQVWMGNLAVTDTARGTFFAAERLSRDVPGIAGIEGGASAPLRIRVEDWSIEIDGDRAMIDAADQEFGIELELSGIERIVAQGDRGLDAKGPEPGNASYYYSAPRLSVTGQVFTGGAVPAVIEGTAWMDREWSTSALSPDMAGWDWFALQLDDGRDIMFYRLRGRDGSTSEFSGGSIADAAGKVTRLEASDVLLTPTRHWRSPVTGIRYPVGWQLAIPDAEIALEIEPRLDNQELDLSVRYWEGAITIAGQAAGRPIGGVGYLELAGY